MLSGTSGDGENEIVTMDQDKGLDAPPLDASSASTIAAAAASPRDILASPRHELELIPEDQPISSTPVTSPLATASVLTGNHPNSSRASAASTPDTSIIRPAALRPTPHPLSRPSSRSSISPVSPVDAPASPAIVRTASTSSVLRHPVPDINARSGSYTSNITALEATAERFSMTSSIDDAIRDAHNELKRSDSRRSSILAASVRSAGDHEGPQGQSSIVGLNIAARIGGYSPGGYIMSPTQSTTGRLRSASRGSSALSRANSTRSKPETLDGEAFPNLSSLSGSLMSRNGPGKGSMRSVRSMQSIRSNRSGPVSLAEIVEMEPPSALTLAAMEEADKTAPRLEDLGDDNEAILARAHQEVEPDATDIEVAHRRAQPPPEDFDETPNMDHSMDPYWDNLDDTNLQLRNPANPPPARVREEQHETSGTPDTVDEDAMFADFDGMHCDPDTVAELYPYHPEEDDHALPPRREPQARRTPAARPQSYFDPETNQQMLYYPARVPAMLNLPPKLGKGLKAAQAARNARRSQVLSQMPKAARESRFWLPDPFENEGSTNFMGDNRPASSRHSVAHDDGPEHALAALEGPGSATQGPYSTQGPPESQQLRRPARLTEGGARQSRLNLADLPPQLRASAFFDMPAESPKIVVKNGSAMDTLDSILDAAAAAPVNAFTDHAFAGHLGSEVYGLEKKKNRKSQIALVEPPIEEKRNRLTKSPGPTTLAVPDNEKRKSVWSLLPGRGKSRSNVNLLNVEEDDARSRLSGSGPGDSDSSSEADEHSALAPDEEDEDEDSASEEEEEMFQGPPTTLLAELQMRKQQQKNRTKNPMLLGNGLHSTLLELDAVAQIEAKQRKNKKINLAWAAGDAEEASDEDEDVPLGLLAVKKQLGPDATEQEMAIAVQELNRPLGLMEKREMDDNEPLSRRRDRLQGKPVPTSMYLQPGGNATRLTVAPGYGSRPVSPRLMRSPIPSPAGSLPSPNPEAADEDEVEGETLAERVRRLRAKEDGDNPLPRARPISRAFSAELLGEFGIDEEAKKEKGKGKENAVPDVEEEETLGQRRRRLQAEREAREKEMGIRAVSDEGTKPALSTPMSMADVLGSNPLEGPQGRMDPREVARRRKEEEAARVGLEQSAKLRAFRSQMPSQLSDPNAGLHKAGGYKNGRFNDNMGGLALPGQQPGRNHHLRASMSVGQLGGQFQQGRAVSGSNLIGAAGSYGNPQVGPDGLNPVFAKQNPFGHGYNGGFMQQPQFQQPQPFVSGSLLASGGYGAFGGGIGGAGGYAANQTAYGAGVGFTNGMPGYGAQAGGMPMVVGPAHAERVERWRQSIR